VVVTGSQLPLGEARTDARGNLLTALLVAAEPAVPEVTLCSAPSSCVAAGRSRSPPTDSTRSTRRISSPSGRPASRSSSGPTSCGRPSQGRPQVPAGLEATVGRCACSPACQAAWWSRAGSPASGPRPRGLRGRQRSRPGRAPAGGDRGGDLTRGRRRGGQPSA
jgi:hypothetical protein